MPFRKVWRTLNIRLRSLLRRVESILANLETFSGFNEDEARELPGIIEPMCRVLHNAVRDDEPHMRWDRLTEDAQKALLSRYGDLADTAVAIRRAVSLQTENAEYAGVRGDVLVLAHNSGEALYVAGYLREFPESVDDLSGAMLPDFLVAILEALKMCQPLLASIPPHRLPDYANNLEASLTRLGQLL